MLIGLHKLRTILAITIKSARNSSECLPCQIDLNVHELEQAMMRMSSLTMSITNFSIPHDFSAIGIAFVFMSFSVCTETDVIECQALR